MSNPISCTSGEAVGLLAGASHLTLISHLRPDGDALGSTLGLAGALAAAGKTVHCLNQDPVPAMYDFLPCKEWILPPPFEIVEGSLVVSLDASSFDRLGSAFAVSGRAVELVIDHHVSNTCFGNVNYVVPQCASTAEIVLSLIREAGWPLTAEVASNLYVGISTDTGSFRYRGTTAQTMRDAAELMDAGADAAWLAMKCYQSVSPARFDLQRRALAELQMEFDGRLAHVTTTPELFRQCGALPEDTEGLVEQGLCVQTVELAAYFEIRDGGALKVSMRSKGKFDVSKVAVKFGGGGHPGAAGVNFETDAEANKQAVLQELRQLVSAAV